MDRLKITVKDERTAEIRFADMTDITTEQLGKFLVDSGQSGYSLKHATVMYGGHQMNEHAVGVRFTVSKSNQ